MCRGTEPLSGAAAPAPGGGWVGLACASNFCFVCTTVFSQALARDHFGGACRPIAWAPLLRALCVFKLMASWASLSAPALLGPLLLGRADCAARVRALWQRARDGADARAARALRASLACGACRVVANGAMLLAFARTRPCGVNGGVVAAILSLTSVFGVAGSWLARDALTRAQLGGVALAAAGVVAVSAPARGGASDGVLTAAALLCAAGNGVQLLLSKPCVLELGGAEFNALVCLVDGAAALPLAAALALLGDAAGATAAGGALSWSTLAGVYANAYLPMAANGLLYLAAARGVVAGANAIASSNTIISSLLIWALGGGALRPLQLAGIAASCAGVAAITVGDDALRRLRARRRTRKAANGVRYGAVDSLAVDPPPVVLDI